METREQKAPHPDSIPASVAANAPNSRSMKEIVLDLLNDTDRAVVESISMMADVNDLLADYDGHNVRSVRAGLRVLLKDIAALRCELAENLCELPSSKPTT